MHPLEYRRVIPRDLFNEASLLKCLGQLYLKLEARSSSAPGTAELAEPPEGIFDGDEKLGFAICQNEQDGSIYAGHVILIVNGVAVSHFRPLNARTPWPLYVSTDGEDISIFDVHGELSKEFQDFIAYS